MSEFYDDREIRDREVREAAQFAELPFQIANARDNAPFYHARLKDVVPEQITSRATLAQLPLTRKSELSELQRNAPPFGGLATASPGDLVRVYQSPGPIYDLEPLGRDYWRTARALHAAGFRGGDVIHNTFSYHFTPAGAMIERGARALGCSVFPAGPANADLQVRAINDLRPTCYAGTPSFLKILLDRGRELGFDTSSLGKASVAAEALPPSLRAELEGEGIRALQWYGTADLGMIAYESSAMEGLIVDEGIIVEIVRPGSGDPVPDGDVGEVVVTVFSRVYPLIRFATGDLSAVMPGRSPCGRTNMRLKGWLGRADQATKVKGMFVLPSQIADVLKRHPEIRKARLVVTHENGRDVMTLHCESEAVEAAAVAESLQSVCKLKGRVELTAPGTLPDDGKVIDDVRRYS
ncbi:MAG: phenylacetate--CoA ligase family protein [Rhodospirillales bacterium]